MTDWEGRYYDEVRAREELESLVVVLYLVVAVLFLAAFVGCVVLLAS